MTNNNMTTIKRLITAAAIALTACTQSEVFENTDTGNAIGFSTPIVSKTSETTACTHTAADTLFADGAQSAALGELFLVRTDTPANDTPTTRVDGSYNTGTAIPSGQHFGVYAYETGTAAFDIDVPGTAFMDNQQVAHDGTYSPIRYWVPESNMSFLAYYPHNGAGITYTGGKTLGFIVNNDITSQVDLMYATPLTDKIAGTALNFDFKHALTRVTFSAKLKSGNIPIQITKIEISGVKNKGNLDITSGTWSDFDGVGTYTFTLDNIISSSTIATDFTELTSQTQLLLPQTLDNNAKVTISYHYGSHEETKSFPLAGREWCRNIPVNYTILLSKDDPDIVYNAGIYEIYTAKGLKAFADLTNGVGNTSDAACLGHGHFDFTQKNLDIDGKLMNDINLEEICNATDNKSWIPIGSYYNYLGVFDGNYKTVSNLYISGDLSSVDATIYGSYKFNGQGLFKNLTGGSISNLNVNGEIKAVNNSAGVVGVINGGGSLTNCTFTGSVTTTGNQIGGVAGFVPNGTITGCTNNATIHSTGNDTNNNTVVGGVVGLITVGSLNNCTNTGTVSGTNNNIGGVAGYVHSAATISNCTNSGNISGGVDFVGGIAATIEGTTITNSHNSGTVTGQTNIGGVVGYVTNSGTAENCTNKGSVSGTNNTGGVVGYVNLNSNIIACANISGEVSATGIHLGGVVGSIHSSAVTACYNTGLVTGGNHLGGVVGVNDNEGIITACYSTGTVTSTIAYPNIGSIVGHNGVGSTDADGNTYGSGTVQYCASVGNVGDYGNGIGSNSGTITSCVAGEDNITKAILNNDAHYDAADKNAGTTGGTAWTAPKLTWQE